MVDPADAEKIKIPLCMLASGDEDAEDVKKFEAGLKGEKYVETFGDQIHGWSMYFPSLAVEYSANTMQWLREVIWMTRGLRRNMSVDIRLCWNSLQSTCEFFQYFGRITGLTLG